MTCPCCNPSCVLALARCLLRVGWSPGLEAPPPSVWSRACLNCLLDPGRVCVFKAFWNGNKEGRCSRALNTRLSTFPWAEEPSQVGCCGACSVLRPALGVSKGSQDADLSGLPLGAGLAHVPVCTHNGHVMNTRESVFWGSVRLLLETSQ